MARINIPRQPHSDTCVWLWSVEGLENRELRWFIDGSAFEPTFYELASTGYAIAAVDSEGTLVALAHGVPPWWIRSAAGAELWALRCVLALGPTVPSIVIDCLGFLTGLKAGPLAMTAGTHAIGL